MRKANGHGIEALAVRRAAMTDADKVRYRVYTTKTEFIAVIAESALMALRVAGVAEPYRIVRDLPTEGVAIAAERMEAGDSGLRVNLATEKVTREKTVSTAPAAASPQNSNFVPMQLGDLDQKHGRTLRVLSAKDMESMTSQSSAPVVQQERAPTSSPMAEAAPATVATEQLSPEQVQALLNE